MERLVRLCVPVEDDWRGAGITTESKRSYELRQQLIRTQNEAFDILDGNYPAHMKVSWRLMIDGDDTEWEWNPQLGVPVEATSLVFVVEGE
jgi:hypothetical protein